LKRRSAWSQHFFQRKRTGWDVFSSDQDVFQFRDADPLKQFIVVEIAILSERDHGFGFGELNDRCELGIPES
jgi:hypothetical protein